MTAAASSAEAIRRRRRAPAAAAYAATPLVPAVQPVPGTEAAARAAEQATRAAARAATARPHIVLDPDLASRPPEPRRGIPAGMSPAEVADQIVATVVQGAGPILLVVPGTLGTHYQTSMLAAARRFARDASGPTSIASIPYPNGIVDIATRTLRIGIGPEQNVLALVLRRLRDAAPHRPILLAGESQGAWLIADTLRQDASLAAAVTRVLMFAKPGFVALPASIGSARTGASLLPANASGVDGVLEFRHTDDIVPSLFTRLRPRVLGGFFAMVVSALAGGSPGYTPHHYDWHDAEGARWLLEGIAPELDTVHESTTHPTHSAG